MTVSASTRRLRNQDNAPGIGICSATGEKPQLIFVAAGPFPEYSFHKCLRSEDLWQRNTKNSDRQKPQPIFVFAAGHFLSFLLIATVLNQMIYDSKICKFSTVAPCESAWAQISPVSKYTLCMLVSYIANTLFSCFAHLSLLMFFNYKHCFGTMFPPLLSMLPWTSVPFMVHESMCLASVTINLPHVPEQADKLLVFLW